jgi:hypothetical protein
VAPAEGQSDEEEVNLDKRGGRSDFHRSFFTILDNILTVDELGRGAE